MRDKFVARRGSQGDSWHWEGDRAPDQPLPVAKVTRTPAASARATLQRATRPVAGVFAATTGAVTRTFSSTLRLIREALEPRRPSNPPNLPTAEKPVTPPPIPAETLASGQEAPELPSLDPPAPPGYRRLIPAFRIPSVSMPKMPRVAMPQVTRSRLQRPAMPTFTRPAMLRSMKLPEISDEMRGPLTLFAALALAAMLSIVIAIGVTVLDDGDSSGDGIVAGVTKTPTAGDPTPGTETPSASGPAETPPAETPPPVVVPPTPQGSVAAALWSNVRGEWWFGDLVRESGQYAEGDFLPVLASWAATPGQTYGVSITYDCATDDAFGAIDYLSGIEDAGTNPLLAPGGPGRDRPDAAIPVPDTADFQPDDGAFGVIYLFGGRFAGLPASPQPEGDCNRQRILDLQVLAESTQITLLLSGHLATAAVWGQDEGASSHDPPFGVEITVAGVGSARVNVTPDAVLDLE